MCTEVNSAMGLQATAATKRKHELTFDSKDVNTSYTNCPPPIKTHKWSYNNNNYIDSLEEQMYINKIETTKSIKNSITNKINNPKHCTTSTESLSGRLSTDVNDNSSCDNSESKTTTPPSTVLANMSQSKAAVKTLVSRLITGTSEVAATTPLSPTSTTPIPEDSIAKLEVVAAVPCEPWTPVSSGDHVDCISKLQAVAVPSDTWGSVTTRSTLATTLLSTDEMDDDDDFEDDYEEEESIIPTYCPLRYHAFSTTSSPHQQQRLSTYGYGSRPNFYSEPFPQQNCSKTGGSQHMRISNGLQSQWQQFYDNGTYVPQHQQTIRCAENGKSYLDLGCSSPISSASNNTNSIASTPTVAQTNFINMPPHLHAANVDVRHNLKRCCEGRGSWCNASKTCYKDLRLKIRNLSMFKLSRFRQVTEQSLYRSVLICNTLKRIDREIEVENKEMQQAAQQHHHNQVAQYHQQHHAATQQQQHYHHTQAPALVASQPLHHTHQPDYNPVLNCPRLGNAEYQQVPSNFQHSLNYHSQAERIDNLTSYQLHKSSGSSNFPSNHNTTINCDSSSSSSISPLHPYDHYPFRESQSGRATPFPTCQPVITPTVNSAHSSTNASAANTSNTQGSISNGSNPSETSDSGYAEDDTARSINWSSVLSLSQSALDPLNNNDLFTILPPTNTITSPVATASASVSNVPQASSASTSIAGTVAINGSFTTVQTSPPSSSSLTSIGSNSTSTTATFTTLSTISAATQSLTSYINSPTTSSTWEYSFLEMEFGLGSEFTELAPNCKLSSEELYKNRENGPASATRFPTVHIHENELEQPAHIMVGS